jgi:hypothetical protein
MCRPISDVSLERSRKTTTYPSSCKIGSAILARRKLLDISPGQVWSLREDPLINRMRRFSFGSSWRLCAQAIASLALIQSIAKS